jgi:hypothetical protein
VANIDTTPYKDIINGLLDKGTTGSIIRKWLNTTFKKQGRDAVPCSATTQGSATDE